MAKTNPFSSFSFGNNSAVAPRENKSNPFSNFTFDEFNPQKLAEQKQKTTDWVNSQLDRYTQPPNENNLQQPVVEQKQAIEPTIKPDLLNNIGQSAINFGAMPNLPTMGSPEMNNRVAGDVIQGGAGIVSGLAESADWLGVEGGHEVANQINEFARQYAPGNPNILDELVSGAASMATFLIPGVGTAGAARLLSFAPKIARGLELGLPVILESFTEAGNTRNQMLNEGRTEEDANKAATISSIANILTIGITNKFGIQAEGNKIKNHIISALLEGGQEGSQDIIDSITQGKEIDLGQVIKSFGLGSVLGAGAKVVYPENVSGQRNANENNQPLSYADRIRDNQVRSSLNPQNAQVRVENTNGLQQGDVINISPEQTQDLGSYVKNEDGTLTKEVNQNEEPRQQPSKVQETAAPSEVVQPAKEGSGKVDKAKSDVSSTQVNLNEADAKPILDYVNKIPEDKLYKEGNDFGRETEPHITALFGLKTKNPKEVENVVKNFGDIELTLGKTSLFKNDKYDVLKVDVKSDDLQKLNKLLKDKLDYQNEFPDYKPHLTLAYLKKGEGDNYVGDTSFEGKKISLNELLFSDRNYKKTKLDLSAQNKDYGKLYPNVKVEPGIKPKEKNITYRGQNEVGVISENQQRTASYGVGLYTTKDVNQAKNYGEVHTVYNAIPEKPLRFRNYEEVKDWQLRESIKLGYKRISEFNKDYPDIGEYIQSKGYDGMQIGFGKDAEYVLYPKGNRSTQQPQPESTPKVEQKSELQSILDYRDSEISKLKNKVKKARLSGSEEIAQIYEGQIKDYESINVDEFIKDFNANKDYYTKSNIDPFLRFKNRTTNRAESEPDKTPKDRIAGQTEGEKVSSNSPSVSKEERVRGISIIGKPSKDYGIYKQNNKYFVKADDKIITDKVDNESQITPFLEGINYANDKSLGGQDNLTFKKVGSYNTIYNSKGNKILSYGSLGSEKRAQSFIDGYNQYFKDKTPSVGKQPYEMTQEEFSNLSADNFAKAGKRKINAGHMTGYTNTLEAVKINYQKRHKDLVKQALKQGKTVPPEVLKDYPDLQTPPQKNIVEGKRAKIAELDKIINDISQRIPPTRKRFWEAEAKLKKERSRENLELYNKLYRELDILTRYEFDPKAYRKYYDKLISDYFEIKDQRKQKGFRNKENFNKLREIGKQLQQATGKAVLVDANDNLYIDKQRITKPRETREKVNIEDVEIKNPKAKTSFEKMSNEEVDRQTFMAEMFAEKKYLPQELQNLLPAGFGQKKIDKGVSDIKQDAGAEQSKEAQIVRDFTKELDKQLETYGYFKLSSGQEVSREDLENELDKYIEERSKEDTDKGDTSFEFGENVKPKESIKKQEVKSNDFQKQYDVSKKESEKVREQINQKESEKRKLEKEIPSQLTGMFARENGELSDEDIQAYINDAYVKGNYDLNKTVKDVRNSLIQHKKIRDEIEDLKEKEDKLFNERKEISKKHKESTEKQSPVEKTKAGDQYYFGGLSMKGEQESSSKKDIGEAGSPLFEQKKEDKNQEEMFNNKASLNEFLDNAINDVKESEAERKQRKLLEGDKLQSSFPFANIVSAIFTKTPTVDITVKSNDKTFDEQFKPRENNFFASSRKRFIRLVQQGREAVTYLSRIKNDPNLTEKEKLKVVREIDILRKDLTENIRNKRNKFKYAIFGDLQGDIQKKVFDLGKYAAAKRLEAIYNNDEMIEEQSRLPYSKEKVGKIVNELEKNISSDVKRSYERMNKILTDYGDFLVNEELIEKTTDNYFPFRVLEYINDFGLMTGNKRVQKLTPGSSKKFQGTEKEYDIDALSILDEFFTQNERAIAYNNFEKNLLKELNKPEAIDENGKAIEGYEEYYYDPRRVFFKMFAVTEKQLNKILTEPDVIGDGGEILSAVREIMAVGGKRGQKYIIPKGLAETLNDLYGNVLVKNIPIISDATRWWKRNMVGRIGLFIPFYHSRNMRTDISKIAANYPASLQYVYEADRFLKDKLNMPQKAFMNYIELTGYGKIAKWVGKIPTKKRTLTQAELKQYWDEGAKAETFQGQLSTEAFGVSERELKTKFLKDSVRKRFREVKEGIGVTTLLDNFDDVARMREAKYRFVTYSYLRGIEGLSPEEAHNEVGKTLINYNHFTAKEKKYLINFLYPFYSWRKGNLATTYEQLTTGNKRQRARILAMMLVSSLGTAIWNYLQAPDDEEKINNDKTKRYIADNFHIATNMFDKNGNRIYIYDQTWVEDITRLFNVSGGVQTARKVVDNQMSVPEAMGEYTWGTLKGNFDEIVGETSPLLKMPYEIQTNQNFFYGFPIYKENDDAFTKTTKLFLYSVGNLSRNYSTLRNLLVGKQDNTLKGLRLSGLPVQSADLSRSLTNYEEFNKQVFNERLKEIKDLEKQVKTLRAEALKTKDSKDIALYQEFNQKLKIARDTSEAYQEYLMMQREKRREQKQILSN